jgi:hypothetical protein
MISHLLKLIVEMFENHKKKTMTCKLQEKILESYHYIIDYISTKFTHKFIFE